MSTLRVVMQTFSQVAASARLGFEVALWRVGMSVPVSIAAVLSTVLLVSVQLLPAREAFRSAQAQLQILARPALAGAPANPPIGANPLEALQHVLAQAPTTDDAIHQMVLSARRVGIDLPRAEYRTSIDSATHVVRQQVALTVKAPYPRLRDFLEDVLRALPNASLDALSFKREAIAQSEVESSIRLSLWSRAAAASPTGEQR